MREPCTHEGLNPFRFKSLRVPGERLIYIDIETDPASSRVWLIGLHADGWFTQFYAESWEKERLILERFLEFLETHRGYTFVSYSGTGFDHRDPERLEVTWTGLEPIRGTSPR